MNIPTISPPPTSRFLSQAECEALAKRAAAMALGGGETMIMLESTWSGNLRYARNQITTTGDTRDNEVGVVRDLRGATGSVVCNQIDDVGLEAAVRRAERLARSEPETGDRRFREHFEVPQSTRDNDNTGQPQMMRTRVLVQTVEPFDSPKLFFDTTYNLRATERTQEIEPLIAAARKANLRAAGYIEVSAHGRAVIDTWGRSLYYPYTQAQFSVTVRDPKGTGSGWAGVDFNDWTRIDPTKLTEIAMDKCLRSRNPVAIEPGRYTAILEPQAVCDIFTPVVKAFTWRSTAEQGLGPYANLKDKGYTKIGEQIFDARVTVSADPMDPDCGFPPFNPHGLVYHPVTWIEQGILKELSYGREYAIQTLGKNSSLYNSYAYRMSGGSDTIEEMIATTKRGLVITRFYGVKIQDRDSLLCTGYTRDGLWLVENGKISKPVKNFRFTESPLFIFNNLEALGTPVRVFNPGYPTVVPPAKVRDFSFTSLVEAV